MSELSSVRARAGQESSAGAAVVTQVELPDALKILFAVCINYYFFIFFIYFSTAKYQECLLFFPFISFIAPLNASSSLTLDMYLSSGRLF